MSWFFNHDIVILSGPLIDEGLNVACQLKKNANVAFLSYISIIFHMSNFRNNNLSCHYFCYPNVACLLAYSVFVDCKTKPMLLW